MSLVETVITIQRLQTDNEKETKRASLHTYTHVRAHTLTNTYTHQKETKNKVFIQPRTLDRDCADSHCAQERTSIYMRACVHACMLVSSSRVAIMCGRIALDTVRHTYTRTPRYRGPVSPTTPGICRLLMRYAYCCDRINRANFLGFVHVDIMVMLSPYPTAWT